MRYDAAGLLLEDDFGGALREESVAAVVGQSDDRAHGLAHRVERVHLVQLLLGILLTNRLVTLTQIHHEAEQRALGLVAQLLGKTAVLRFLQSNASIIHMTCLDATPLK